MGVLKSLIITTIGGVVAAAAMAGCDGADAPGQSLGDASTLSDGADHGTMCSEMTAIAMNIHHTGVPITVLEGQPALLRLTHAAAPLELELVDGPEGLTFEPGPATDASETSGTIAWTPPYTYAAPGENRIATVRIASAACPALAPAVIELTVVDDDDRDGYVDCDSGGAAQAPSLVYPTDGQSWQSRGADSCAYVPVNPGVTGDFMLQSGESMTQDICLAGVLPPPTYPSFDVDMVFAFEPEVGGAYNFKLGPYMLGGPVGIAVMTTCGGGADATVAAARAYSVTAQLEAGVTYFVIIDRLAKTGGYVGFAIEKVEDAVR